MTIILFLIAFINVGASFRLFGADASNGSKTNFPVSLDAIEQQPEHLGDIKLGKVTQVLRNTTEEIFQIYYGESGPADQTSSVVMSPDDLVKLSSEINLTGGSLLVTGEHPFYVANRHDFITVRMLHKGDCFLDSSHNKVIYRGKRIIHAPEGQMFTTYNLEVEGSHTYFAGPEGLWVHNACPWSIEKSLSIFRHIFAEKGGDYWEAYEETLTFIRTVRDGANKPIGKWDQRRLYLEVQREFRAAGGLTVDCHQIPLASDSENLMDNFFRKLGKWVEPNPDEDAPDALKIQRKAYDRLIDGVQTEYYSPESQIEKNFTYNFYQKVKACIDKKAQELVVDVTGNAAYTVETKAQCLEAARERYPSLVVKFFNSDHLE